MIKKGYTLTEVLMVLIFIGIISTMTVPLLNKHTDDKEIVDNFFEFNDILGGAISQWKLSLSCPYYIDICLNTQKQLTSKPLDFSQIASNMKIVEVINKGPSDQFWLPIKTLNYYGTNRSDYDFRTNSNRTTYLLVNGMIFSVHTDSNGFWLVVDVNGKKPPNRIGKDTFHITIGYNTDNDINYNAREKTSDGICGHGLHGKTKCDANNINPKLGNGASPTAYTMVHHKTPDFGLLSQEVDGFQP